MPYGHDFVARYLFDGDGRFLNATIHDLGERSTGEPAGNALFDNADAESLQHQMIDELGEVEFGDINVAPFSYESHGTTFGLIAQPPEEEDTNGRLSPNPETTWRSILHGMANTTPRMRHQLVSCCEKPMTCFVCVSLAD